VVIGWQQCRRRELSKSLISAQPVNTERSALVLVHVNEDNLGLSAAQDILADLVDAEAAREGGEARACNVVPSRDTDHIAMEAAAAAIEA
jgi:hypothetical protein